VSISNGELISLIYEVQHSHIRRVEASKPTSVFALVFDTEYNESYGRVFKTLFTKHPQYHRLDFTGQHYTTVAEYFMEILHPLYVFGCKSCYSYADQCHYFSLYQNADEFHIAEDTKKRNHSKTLLVLLYIAHLLPLACMSEHILESIFSPEYTESGRRLRNFHVDFTLDEWNDDIIQPARDTVLDYYKVHMRPLSLPTVLTLKPIQPIFICFSALRRAIQCRRVHVCQQSILVSTCVWLSPLVDVLSFGQSLPYSYNHSLTSSIINSRRNLLWYHYLTIRGNFRSRRYTLQSEDACGLTQLSKEIHI